MSPKTHERIFKYSVQSNTKTSAVMSPKLSVPSYEVSHLSTLEDWSRNTISLIQSGQLTETFSQNNKKKKIKTGVVVHNKGPVFNNWNLNPKTNSCWTLLLDFPTGKPSVFSECWEHPITFQYLSCKYESTNMNRYSRHTLLRKIPHN